VYSSESRNETCFNIGVATGPDGDEISWTLGSCASSQKYLPYKAYIEECCLESGDYILTCKDSKGNGWGINVLVFNSQTLCNKGEIGYSYVSPNKITLAKPKREICFEIILHTSTNADQMLWTIYTQNYSPNNCLSAQQYSDNSMYTEECCLEKADNYYVHCMDAGRNGWGDATFKIDGVSYCNRDFTWGTGQRLILPTDAPTSNPTRIPTPAPTYFPTFYPSEATTSNPTPMPTPAPTHVPTLHSSDAPTLYPTPIPTGDPSADCVETEQNWTAEIAEQLCSADEMGKTNKGVNAVVCPGNSQFYQRRLNYSLANRVYTHCSAWCVYDAHTEGYGDPSEHYDAFIWRNLYDCWEPVTTGLCINEKRDDRDSMADYIENTLCKPLLPLFTWDEDRAEEICADIVSANKSYRVEVCDDPNSSTKQDSLDKSLANRFFTHCKAFCVYDHDTIMNNIRMNNTVNPSYGGFMWKSTCWKWVTGWDCFTKHISEFQAVSSRAANFYEL